MGTLWGTTAATPCHSPTIYADIELEYRIPSGSDAVKEVAKCVQYCKEALA